MPAPCVPTGAVLLSAATASSFLCASVPASGGRPPMLPAVVTRNGGGDRVAESIVWFTDWRCHLVGEHKCRSGGALHRSADPHPAASVEAARRASQVSASASVEVSERPVICSNRLTRYSSVLGWMRSA